MTYWVVWGSTTIVMVLGTVASALWVVRSRLNRGPP